MARAPRLQLESLETREVPAFGLDPTFGTEGVLFNPLGTTERFQSVAAAAADGGKFTFAGNLPGTEMFGTGGDVAVARVDATGAADPAFGGGDGLATFGFSVPHTVTAMAALPDGKLLVAGTLTEPEGYGQADVFVLRLNANGTIDTNYGTGGETTLDLGGSDALNRVAVAGDGSVVFYGTTTRTESSWYTPPTSQLVLGRLRADGRPDAAFGVGGTVVAAADPSGSWYTGGLALQPDGKVVVSGRVIPNYTYSTTDGKTELTALRFNADGTPDAAFGAGGRAATNYGTFTYAGVTSLVVLSDGRVVVGGGTTFGQGLLAWFDPTGALIEQEQFGETAGGGLSYVTELLASPSGGVTAIGASGYTGGFAVAHHAAPGAAGGVVAVNPGGGYAIPTAVAIAGDGKLLVATQSGQTIPPYPPVPAAALALTRFSDPGLTASRTTYLTSFGPTYQPEGLVPLIAHVSPLLGTEPVGEGTVTFREGGTVLATMPAGGADVVMVPLSAGDHVITADYSGSARWAASHTSFTLRLTPVAAATVGLAVSDANPAYGEPVGLTATVSLGGATPVGGTVTFYDGEALIGVMPLGFDGTARFTTPPGLLARGAHALRAEYDDGMGAAHGESPSVTVDVSRAYTEVALAVPAGPPTLGQPVTLTATVSTPTSRGVVPAGKVTFYDGSTVLGTGPIGPDGVATLTTAALRFGAHTLRAGYDGDANAFGSMSAPKYLTVGKAVTGTAVAASAASVAAGQSVALTATVQAPGGVFPVGTVEFRAGGKVLGTAAVDGRGQAKFTAAGLAGGAHAITAVYLGSSTCQGSTSAAATVTVAGSAAPTATVTKLAASAAAPVFGQTQTLTATATAAGVPVTQGQVYFYAGSTALGAAALDARGVASIAATLNLGTHKLRAVYVGTTAYIGSESAVLTQTVAKAPTAVAFTAFASAGMLTLQAVVRPQHGGSPIGTVTFLEGTKVLGTAAVNGNGVAVLKLGTPTAGTHAITAVYGGSSVFLGATSDPLSVAV